MKGVSLASAGVQEGRRAQACVRACVCMCLHVCVHVILPKETGRRNEFRVLDEF